MINLDEFSKGDILGNGFNCKVYKFTNPSTNDDIAVKLYRLDMLSKKMVYNFKTGKYQDLTSIAYKELKYYQAMSNIDEALKYMPQYLGCKQDTNKLLIGMELSSKSQIYFFNNELNTYEINSKIIDIATPIQLSYWVIDMIDCLDFMHKNHYAHMDIKIENYLLFDDTDRLKVKLTDFNSVQHYDLSELGNPRYGTFLYAPPETIFSLDETYNPYKTDIWALGVCIYILFTSKLPFKVCNEATNYELAYSSSTKHTEPDYSGFNDDLTKLLQNMMHKDNELRYDIEDVKMSEFYIKYKK